MTVPVTPNANVWFEPPAAYDALPVRAWFNETASGVFEYVTAGDQDAILYNWKFDRDTYDFIVLANRYVLVDDGSGRPTPAASGTEFAILIAYGDDGLQLSTDLTQEEAGAFYLDTLGRLVPVRFDSPQMDAFLVGTTVRTYT